MPVILGEEQLFAGGLESPVCLTRYSRTQMTTLNVSIGSVSQERP
jgi:hypothetical protein